MRKILNSFRFSATIIFQGYRQRSIFHANAMIMFFFNERLKLRLKIASEDPATYSIKTSSYGTGLNTIRPPLINLFQSSVIVAA